jgi:hypothetical protein
MKKISLAVLAILLSIDNVHAQPFSPPEFPQSEKSVKAFIPKGYSMLEDAEGDLNGDGIADKVFVIERNDSNNWMMSDSVDTYERILVILFREADHYILKDTNSRCILCKACGGAFGDPFAGLDIKKRVLTISHYGGSNWRWSFDRKFRYQNDAFYLIGATDHSFLAGGYCEKYKENAATHYTDVNFITGKRYRENISEDCKHKDENTDVVEKRPLVSLKDYYKSTEEKEDWWMK